SASVTALRESKLSFVSRAAFHAFAQDNPDLYRQAIRLLARRLTDTNAALVATTFLSLQGRVARSLLSLAEGFGHDARGARRLVRQKITQSDLAAMAGIARENVSRILRSGCGARSSRAWPVIIVSRTKPRSSTKPRCSRCLQG